MRRRREADDGDQEIAELAALADGSISPERRAVLEARVAGSTELASLLAEQQQAVTLAQSAAGQVEAPAGLRARVDAQRTARRSRRPGRLVLAGAVGTAAVVAAIGVTVLRSGSSAQHFTAALGPTSLEPGAGGDADLTKTSAGWRITLETRGLPRRDGGRFYEAWLRNSAGVLVPIGTFNEGPKVTLWAGVSPQDFPTLTVTRERADGNQASSGDKVLVGQVDAGASG
jgi:hypothetical protein